MKWQNPRTANRIRALFFISGSLVWVSCQTTENYRSVQLPAYAGAYFSECSSKDGSVSIELYESAKVQQIFDADWNANAKGDVSLASYSPLGQTLFQLNYLDKSRSFSQTGKPFPALQNLSVGKDQIIQVDGHDIGLRSDEIGCLLNHKLPQRWLKKIVSEENDQSTIRYIAQDTDRVIKIELPKHGNKSAESWKVTVNWSLYFGFKKLQLTVKRIRDEQAIVLHANQFEAIDVRIVAQEE